MSRKFKMCRYVLRIMKLHCAQSQLFTAGRSEKVKTILHDISSGDLLFQKKSLQVKKVIEFSNQFPSLTFL